MFICMIYTAIYRFKRALFLYIRVRTAHIKYDSDFFFSFCSLRLLRMMLLYYGCVIYTQRNVHQHTYGISAANGLGRGVYLSISIPYMENMQYQIYITLKCGICHLCVLFAAMRRIYANIACMEKTL